MLRFQEQGFRIPGILVSDLRNRGASIQTLGRVLGCGLRCSLRFQQAEIPRAATKLLPRFDLFKHAFFNRAVRDAFAAAKLAHA